LRSTNLLQDFLQSTYNRYAYKGSIGWYQIQSFAQDMHALNRFTLLCRDSGQHEKAIYLAIESLSFLIEALENSIECHDNLYEIIEDFSSAIFVILVNSDEKTLRQIILEYSHRVVNLPRPVIVEEPLSLRLIRICFQEDAAHSLTALFEELESNDFGSDMTLFLLAEILIHKRLENLSKVNSLIAENLSIPAIRAIQLYAIRESTHNENLKLNLRTAIAENRNSGEKNASLFLREWRQELFYLLKAEDNTSEAYNAALDILQNHGYHRSHLNLLLSLFELKSHPEVKEKLLTCIDLENPAGKKLYYSILAELDHKDELAKSLLREKNLWDMFNYDHLMSGQNKQGFIEVYKNQFEKSIRILMTGHGYDKIISLAERLMILGEIKYVGEKMASIQKDHGRKKSLIAGLQSVSIKFQNGSA
jgi:hypothetical protein